VELQIAQANPALCHIKVAASCGVASGQPGPPGGIPGAVYRVVTWHNLALPMGQWHQIQLQGGFTASSGGQNLFCASSSFETIEPY
jgi:hypothetical protein